MEIIHLKRNTGQLFFVFTSNKEKQKKKGKNSSSLLTYHLLNI